MFVQQHFSSDGPCMSGWTLLLAHTLKVGVTNAPDFVFNCWLQCSYQNPFSTQTYKNHPLIAALYPINGVRTRLATGASLHTLSKDSLPPLNLLWAANSYNVIAQLN